MALAPACQTDAMLVTELSRLGGGRSTMDLLVTLKELKVRQVSFVGLNGMTFDPATPYGRMMATVLTGIADDAVSAVMRSSTPDPERTAA